MDEIQSPEAKLCDSKHHSTKSRHLKYCLNSSIAVFDTARVLGVVVDSCLTTAVCRAGYFHRRQLLPVNRSLTLGSAKTRPVARGVRLVRSNPPQPPAVQHVENTTCNCCGRSCKLPNISVKMQLNLHQNEPFQVKKSQNFLGKGHSHTSPEPSQLIPGTAAVRRRRASDRNRPLS